MNDALRFPRDGSRIVLGRDPSCDIVLHGMGVSRRHASILPDQASCIIFDENSSFGLRVNGTPLERHVLAPGDMLAIGVNRFTVDISETHLLLMPLVESDECAGIALQQECGDRITIGRDIAATMVLAHPLVSRLHATARRDGTGFIIADENSTNGTFVNGRPVSQCVVSDGDMIQIGPFRLFVGQGRLVRAGDDTRIRIEAFGLTVRVKKAVLVDRVTITVPSGAFVAVLGASGAGKSTLIRALCGRQQISGGSIFANQLPLTQFLNAFASSIGYVAQENLLHPELTVAETFAEQCLIRLPADSSPLERQARIAEVVSLLELDKVQNRRVSRLSGGEAKRVHLGVELLASPALVVLDEPLAGLDPGLVRKFMRLFRRISDRGQTLLMTTHTLEQIDSCDRIIFMHKGRVAYAGAPSGLEASFGSAGLADVYDAVAHGASAHHTGGAAERMAPAPASGTVPFRKPRTVSFFRQFAMLVSRYVRIAVRDRRNFLLLMLQAPAIAVFLGFVFASDSRFLPLSFYFCVTISAIWISGINAAQEVAREWLLLQREYRIGLSLAAYLYSKMTVIALFALVQAVLFWGAIGALFPTFPFTADTLLLMAAGTLSGGILGLCISALSKSVGRAITVLPMIFIPQIFFSGILIPFDRMSDIGRGLSYLTVSRPVFGLFKHVCVLERPVFESTAWPELCLLCGGLIILTMISVRWRVRRQ